MAPLQLLLEAGHLMRSAPCWVGALEGKGTLFSMVGVLRCIKLPQATSAAVCWAMSSGNLIYLGYQVEPMH